MDAAGSTQRLRFEPPGDLVHGSDSEASISFAIAASALR